MSKIVMETLYDPGNCKKFEDKLIVHQTRSGDGDRFIVAVIDGVDTPWSLEEKPILYDGRTGGQMAAHEIYRAITSCSPDEALEAILKRANFNIKANIQAHGMDNVRSGLYPGASFVIASINKDSIGIIQGGDCIALWEYFPIVGSDDPVVSGTPNSVYPHTKEAHNIVRKHIHQHGGSWSEAVNANYEELTAIQDRVNTSMGWASLNGQPEFMSQSNVFFLYPNNYKYTRLILCTDGFVPFHETSDIMMLSERIFTYRNKANTFRNNFNLSDILDRTHRFADQDSDQSPPHYAEATAVAIELKN